MKLLLASLLLVSTGCAHVVEFRPLNEFKGGKVKEDPPGTLLPLPKSGVRTC